MDRLRNHCCRKAVSITYYDGVSVALVIHHAKRMRHVILSPAWPVWLYNIFPHYLIKGTIFGEKVIDKKVCFDLLYKFCMKYFLSHEEFSEALS
jgi:hypothetical protein